VNVDKCDKLITQSYCFNRNRNNFEILGCLYVTSNSPLNIG